MPHSSPDAERSPSDARAVPAAGRRGLLSQIAYVLRGEKYMADAYPPAPRRDER